MQPKTGGPRTREELTIIYIGITILRIVAMIVNPVVIRMWVNRQAGARHWVITANVKTASRHIRKELGANAAEALETAAPRGSGTEDTMSKATWTHKIVVMYLTSVRWIGEVRRGIYAVTFEQDPWPQVTQEGTAEFHPDRLRLEEEGWMRTKLRRSLTATTSSAASDKDPRRRRRRTAGWRDCPMFGGEKNREGIDRLKQRPSSLMPQAVRDDSAEAMMANLKGENDISVKVQARAKEAMRGEHRGKLSTETTMPLLRGGARYRMGGHLVVMPEEIMSMSRFVFTALFTERSRVRGDPTAASWKSQLATWFRSPSGTAWPTRVD